MRGRRAAALWVAEDGRFGAGPLRGRHAKTVAEHIGAGARAAAREQRITALEAELVELQRRHEADASIHPALVAFRAGLREIAAAVPATMAVDDSGASASGAIRDAQRAAVRAATLRTAAAAGKRVAPRTPSWILRLDGHSGVTTEAQANGKPSIVRMHATAF